MSLSIYKEEIYIKKRLCSVITAMILLICSTVFVFASETEEVTWGDFLTQHGITLGEQPEVSYTTVSTGSIMTYSDNGSSAVRIKNPLSNGEVEEYLIVGMELADDEIQPTSFTANANARNTFLRTIVPSEIQNAPILLYVRTEYTMNANNPGCLNPKSITFSYSINDSTFISAPLISCIYDVRGKPIYGNDPEVPAYGWFGYDGISVYYQVQCSVASPTAEISYTASKTYPSGHYIAAAYDFGQDTISVSGQISTTSGTKNFSFQTFSHY